jgi:hypothetical protein
VLQDGTGCVAGYVILGDCHMQGFGVFAGEGTLLGRGTFRGVGSLQGSGSFKGNGVCSAAEVEPAPAPQEAFLEGQVSQVISYS